MRLTLPGARATATCPSVAALALSTVLSFGCSEQTREPSVTQSGTAQPSDSTSEPPSPATAPVNDDTTSAPSDAGPPTHRAVLVEIDQGTFRVQRIRTLEGPLPKTSHEVSGHDRLGYEVLDATGAVVGRGSVPNPGAVHGEFKNPDTGRTERVDAQNEGPQLVMVRVPESAASIRFLEMKDGGRNVLGAVQLTEGVSQ